MPPERTLSFITWFFKDFSLHVNFGELLEITYIFKFFISEDIGDDIIVPNLLLYSHIYL